MSPTRATLTQDLPAILPEGEKPLWRSGPDGRLLARQALHVRKVALYFGILIAWRILLAFRDGAGMTGAIDAVVTTFILGVVVVAGLYGYAVWSARTTSYTLTSERIVMRTGIALPITINLPFAKMHSVDVRRSGELAGDIEITLTDDARVSWLVLWPSVKRWHFSRPRPVLRALADVEKPAALFAAALAEYARRNGVAESAAAETPTAAPGTPVAAST